VKSTHSDDTAISHEEMTIMNVGRFYKLKILELIYGWNMSSILVLPRF